VAQHDARNTQQVYMPTNPFAGAPYAAVPTASPELDERYEMPPTVSPSATVAAQPVTISWASMWRIALAVCLGVLTAGAISGLIALLFLGHVFSGSDPSSFASIPTDGSTLSNSCKGAIDLGEDSATIDSACSDDDLAAVTMYEYTVDGK
jgi:hypothetical protein